MSGAQQRIGRTKASSVERLPDAPRAPEGAPNILVILLDDVGFAQLGCFGATVRTPNIDRLAAEGLRYTNFHTTALCSPTRASLLTGRNPHAVGFGIVTERLSGFPGYSMRLPDSAATVAEILRRNGYSTRAVGKWHLTPSYETGPQGPYDRWPLGRGFQRFYGFLSGVADQYTPELVRDNSLTRAPAEPRDGYHLSADLVDESIAQLAELQALAPGLPFFHYLAFGAAHAPHQVPAEWIDRYRGAFDHGWDRERELVLQRQIDLGVMPPGTRLGPPNPGVVLWDDLSDAERHAYARMMEVYAGFVEHTDAQIGRLLDHLDRTGALDDTLVLLMSDNGASAEGGPQGIVDTAFDDVDLAANPEAVARLAELGGPDLDNHYPWGWAQAGNTPFRWYKQFTHAGGNTNGLLIRWPGGGVPAGGIRRHYHHVVDITPTLLDVAGVEPPESVGGVTQQPMHGVSMRNTFADPHVESRRHSQHYEMFGNRGLWRDGWMAVARLHPTAAHSRPPVRATPTLGEVTWELYDHRNDPTECDDLAEAHPELLRELVDLWWAAAGAHQVLPVDDRPRDENRPTRIPLPAGADPRRTTFSGTGGPYERGGAPRIAGVPFRLEADVTLPAGPASGVLFAMGGRHGGYCWYLHEGSIVFEVTTSSLRFDRVSASLDARPGHHLLALDVRVPDEGAPHVDLSVDGHLAGSGTVDRLVNRFPVHAARCHVGRSADRTGSRSFTPPYAFTGTVHRLTVLPDCTTTAPDDEEAEMREQ